MEILAQLAPYSAVIPIVFMVNEALKSMGMPTRFAMAVNIVVGLIVGVAFASYMDRELLEGVFGVLYGLATGGAYSGIKAAMTDRREHEAVGYELDV
jgi:Na+/H+-translocating membrane pyrophosphatase